MDFADFDALLCCKESPSSEELGGPAAIRQFAPRFLKSDHADRLAGVMSGSGDSLRTEYLEFAVGVLRENPYPLVVASVGEKLAGSAVPPKETKSVQSVLLERARQRTSNLDSDMASECLAAAVLLASRVSATQPAVVAALDEVEPGEYFQLVRRVALLAGLAWHWDQSRYLEELLKRLVEDKDAGEQAAFELGMISVDRALSSQDRGSMVERLNDAAMWFASAEDIDPQMPEAKALRGAIRAFTLFCENAPAGDVEQQIAEACEAASERFELLDTSALRAWLRPRVDAQTSWYELACALKGLSTRMSEDSWLRALAVLQQIGNLRCTLVSLATASGDELRTAVTHRLASGFAAREGLRAHLHACANDTESTEASRKQARELLAVVDNIRNRQGKPGPLASAGGLVSGTEVQTTTESGDALPCAKSISSAFNQLQEKCYLGIVAELQKHEDYRGGLALDINAILVCLIRFQTYCLNVSREMAGPAYEFLFETNGTLPLEKDLQICMFQTMQFHLLAFPNHQIQREVHDVAQGRADIAITRDRWQLVLELKREIADASRDGLAKYLGQAATYPVSQSRISFLVVLDVCRQRKWPLMLDDNSWVDRVQGPGDSKPRLVIVMRIPGQRPVPSHIVTPTSEQSAKIPQVANSKHTARRVSKGTGPGKSGSEVAKQAAQNKSRVKK
jgi:hypothetical protein